MNPKVDVFLSKTIKWQEEIEKLRKIIITCGLNEELKWGKPCYMFEKSNIVIIQAFKEYLALGFFKGYMLYDSKKILVAPGKNSQTMRQLRFSGVQDIVKLRPIVKAYIYEAVELKKSGLKAGRKEKTIIKLPKELQNKLDTNQALKTAFYALTPGRQRAYIIYFSGAKQSKTRALRIEKYIQQILNGKGLNDYYIR